MRSRLLTLGLASLLLACGGGDDANDTTTVNDTNDTGDEDTSSGEGDEGDVADSDEPPAEEGGPCYPVSRCHSFANQDCAPISVDGEIEGEAFSAGTIREACPGQRGVSDALQECFSYVEISEGCGRRMPDIAEPAWPCGRNEDGTCGVQM